jgi:glucose/arabinose dehydrogenase
MRLWQSLQSLQKLVPHLGQRDRRPSGRRRGVYCTLRGERLEERLSLSTLPSGFVESLVAGGMNVPTAMALAPDGRIFVAEQTGGLRVIKNGALLATPFLNVAVNSAGERGLLGVAFDPAFAVNHFLYVYYTTADSPLHNRVSRFTAQGDVVVPGSETVILELDNLSGATNHNGGAIHFGADGKLYVGVGDNAQGSNSQNLANRLGKMLRINSDGTIPADNPFVATASGANQAIWAIGLRNPFTFAVDPQNGRMFINDVGQNTWEEINDGVAGANYGWPQAEGPSTNPAFRSPLFAYGHGAGNTAGCAIAGGAFYSPEDNQFPAEYDGDYFFADLCNDWIRSFDPATGSAAQFATDLPAGTVDLFVDPSGSLFFLSRGAGSNTGSVFQIDFPDGQHTAPWQNSLNPADVNGQDGVTTNDALIVINDLNANNPRLLPAPTADRPPPYLDVNGDGFVAPIDALIVINVLNSS